MCVPPYPTWHPHVRARGRLREHWTTTSTGMDEKPARTKIPGEDSDFGTGKTTPTGIENIEPEPTNSRPVRSNRGVPHPKFQDYHTYSAWSASAEQIKELNRAIGA